MIRDLRDALLLILAGTVAQGFIAVVALFPAIVAVMPSVFFWRIATDATGLADIFLAYLWWMSITGFLLERIDPGLLARFLINGAEADVRAAIRDNAP